MTHKMHSLLLADAHIPSVINNDGKRTRYNPHRGAQGLNLLPHSGLVSIFVIASLKTLVAASSSGWHRPAIDYLDHCTVCTIARAHAHAGKGFGVRCVVSISFVDSQCSLIIPLRAPLSIYAIGVVRSGSIEKTPHEEKVLGGVVRVVRTVRALVIA